nr:hypothetical protein [Gammaproteobacteria bacterium]
LTDKIFIGQRLSLNSKDLNSKKKFRESPQQLNLSSVHHIRLKIQNLYLSWMESGIGIGLSKEKF